MKPSFAKCVVFFLTLTLGSIAHAGWRSGKVRIIASTYEGDTMAFTLVGVTPSCSCPSYWANHMCLDGSRATYSQEYALLLSAKARDMTIHANIDEATCLVKAIYESW